MKACLASSFLEINLPGKQTPMACKDLGGLSSILHIIITLKVEKAQQLFLPWAKQYIFLQKYTSTIFVQNLGTLWWTPIVSAYPPTFPSFPPNRTSVSYEKPILCDLDETDLIYTHTHTHTHTHMHTSQLDQSENIIPSFGNSDYFQVGYMTQAQPIIYSLS